MDARKGACRDAIEGMAMFGWVLGVCEGVVAGTQEARSVGARSSTARRSAGDGRDLVRFADRMSVECIERHGDLFEFDGPPAVPGMEESGRVPARSEER